MDVLSGFLDGPRAREAFVLRCLLDPPWSLRIQDRAPLTLVAIVRQVAWAMLGDADPVRLEPGDIAIFRGPDPYVVADDPATRPQMVIDAGGVCQDLAGNSLHDLMTLGVRTWGHGADADTVFLTATYETDGEVSERLLTALPRLVVVPGERADRALVEALAREVQRDEPGQQVVLDRLLDVLLVATLRAWFAGPDVDPPGWFRGDRDPLVGHALRLLHHDPQRPWTVASLAAAVGASRAGLARRFTELVGEPPMAYLTSWRMALAADLLRDPLATVGSVAHTVGYTSPFTFSTAFKRVHGASPSSYRRTDSQLH